MFLKSNKRGKVKKQVYSPFPNFRKEIQRNSKVLHRGYIEASKISNLTKISEATLCKIFRENKNSYV